MPLPLQEAVDKEIRQHAFKALQKNIFPPKVMTFPLSAVASVSPAGDGQAPLSAVGGPHDHKRGAHACARAQAHGDKALLAPGASAASGKASAAPFQQRSQTFHGAARAEGKAAMAAAQAAVSAVAGSSAAGGAGAGGAIGREQTSCSSEGDDDSELDAATEEEGDEKQARDKALLPAGQVCEESLGVTLTRFKDGGPVILTKVQGGRPAARSGLLQQGDELIEIGMQPVSRARLEVIAALLAWPDKLNLKLRLVQLSIHRGRSLLHVNIEQKRPEHMLQPDPRGAAGGGSGSRAGKEVGGAKGPVKCKASAGAAEAGHFASIEKASISAPTNVQRQASVTVDPHTGELLGVPREWQVARARAPCRLPCLLDCEAYPHSIRLCDWQLVKAAGCRRGEAGASVRARMCVCVCVCAGLVTKRTMSCLGLRGGDRALMCAPLAWRN